MENKLKDFPDNREKDQQVEVLRNDKYRSLILYIQHVEERQINKSNIKTYNKEKLLWF